MPSSSSIGGDGDSLNSALWMDSNVLRLIRRYDPIAASAISIRSRRSLENNRRGLQENNEKSKSSLTSTSSVSCSFLPQRSSTIASTHEDNCSKKQSLTPRLQRQQTIYEQDALASSSTTTAAHRSSSARPVLKYTPPTPRADLNAQSKKTESLTQPLSIEIEPHVPSSSSIISNENTITYQPLITTGTKRVCAAISKSEWDLRFQHDPFSPITPSSSSTFPVQPSSPHTIINQQQEKELYRPLFDRNESSIGTKTNNEQKDNIDDIHEYSSSNIAGSCIEKLKQKFNVKPSLELTTSPTSKQQQQNDSIESNLNRYLNTNGTSIDKADLSSITPTLMQKMSNTNTIESVISKTPSDHLVKSTNTNQENLPTSSPLFKRPILKSQKAFDSTDLLDRSNSGNLMPASEISHDAYRFRRLNDQDQIKKTRLKNVAKVEPYSVNTNLVRPLYHLANSQPTTTTTIATTKTTPSKAHTLQNNTINNLPNSSTSSAASLNGTIRHPNVRNSDFLVPNPAYSTSAPPPPLHPSQPPSTSSSYATPPTSMLLSESLSHISPQRIPQTTHTALSNGRSTNLASSINNSKQKHQSSMQPDFHSGKPTHSPITYRDANGIIVNKNHYEEFDNYTSLGSYHYRPKEHVSSTTAINNSFANSRQQSQGLICPPQIEQLQHDRFNNGQQQQSQQQQQQQNQSRRRFQRRKQMKRSKSADLYQDLTSTSSKNQNNHNCFFPSTILNESNRYHRQQRSISRDLIGGGGGDGNLSSSSSSSLSTANIERINRAALLRYKSLDSMTFNNRNASLNAKTNNRRALSKPTNADFDSDDSVCGIPKPRKTIGR